jgi:mycothiol synthase
VTARRVRPFAERDYNAYARLASLGEGVRLEPDEARALDARWDHTRFYRSRVVVVDEEDAPLGFGEIRQEPSRYDPGRYFLRLAVDPSFRRTGIGAALWDALAIELRARDAEIACLWIADATACQAFVTKRRFVEVGRAYLEVIAVATAPLPTPAIEERVAALDVRIATLAQLRVERGDVALEAAWDLHYACRTDQPTLGRVTAQPYAEWLAFNVDDPAAIPEAYFVALSGERLVGMSSLRHEGEDSLRIGVTGVLPSFRRRGIGRALKLRVHAWARANGMREIHTSTAASNRPMVALNDALGYVTVGSVGGYELRLRA